MNKYAKLYNEEFQKEAISLAGLGATATKVFEKTKGILKDFYVDAPSNAYTNLSSNFGQASTAAKNLATRATKKVSDSYNTGGTSQLITSLKENIKDLPERLKNDVDVKNLLDATKDTAKATVAYGAPTALAGTYAAGGFDGAPPPTPKGFWDSLKESYSRGNG